MNNPREFDKVYTTRFNNTNKGVYKNQKNYFSGYPFLNSIKVKGISIQTLNIQYVYTFLTLVDKNNNTVLYNMPFGELLLDIIQPKSKLRLFNLDGVNLLNSYWISTTNLGGSSDPLFTISFYS
jgi:hypothetical protein